MSAMCSGGSGGLAIMLYSATEDDFAAMEGGLSGKPGTFADTPVTVTIDGKHVAVPAAEALKQIIVNNG